MSPVRLMTRSQGIRLKPPLPREEVDARLQPLQDFWRIRRWLVMRPALVAPAPAKASACRLGVSVGTVRDLLEASNRYGPDALEPPGKGPRQRAYRAVEDAPTFWAPLLADSPAGHRAMARPIPKAWAASLGHPIAPSTVSR